MSVGGIAIQVQLGVWKFGAHFQGEPLPLSCCLHCAGHATAEGAIVHWREWLAEKRGAEVVAEQERGHRLTPGEQDNDLRPVWTVLEPDGKRTVMRRCIDCETPFAAELGTDTRYQRWRCWACQACYAAAADEQAVSERYAELIKVRERLWTSCGVDELYQTESLDTFVLDGRSAGIQNAHGAAVAWAEAFNPRTAQQQRGLLFSGVRGTGKTHLAASIARRVIGRMTPSRAEVLEQRQREQQETVLAPGEDPYGSNERSQRWAQAQRWAIEHFTVRFWDAATLLGKLQDGRFVGSDNAKLTEEALYANVSAARLLVIDDLGRVTRKSQREDQAEMWFRVFNARYTRKLPMIVTTNVPIDELESIVGGAVVSRLWQMFDFVQMDGEDYRPLKR